MKKMVWSALAAVLLAGSALAQDSQPDAGSTDIESAAADDENAADRIASVDWPVPEIIDVVCPFEFGYEPGDMS
ncbi:hypothetical protein [Hyphobacterium sp.]|jgi:hypothetical protein|uniref:hypothetical protein n=1 Tax=Hyphobacterium sp. TaxID=2004662 RepID=UPI003BA8DF18